MKPLYDATIEYFPESFKLLQKEAFLANSCILSGFDFLIKGRFESGYVGAYFAAFFHLTIGIERLLKLVYVSNYMMENNMNFPQNKDIKEFGHGIDVLLKECDGIGEKYGIRKEKLDSIDESIISFLTSFADAKKGRYFNFLGKYQEENNPLWGWQNICFNILKNDIAKKNKIVREQLALIEDKSIDDDMKAIYIFPQLFPKCNHYAVLRIIRILAQFVRTLEKISLLHHKRDIEIDIGKYPDIPYYGNIFCFAYIPRDYILRKKRWIDYISY